MSMMEIPNFQYSKQSAQGREERMKFITDEVKKTLIITLKVLHILKKDAQIWHLLKILLLIV